MFLKRETRIGAAVALVAVLTLASAAPAGAAGWSGWEETGEWSGGLVPRVLSWLGLGPAPMALPKCDCPRKSEQGSQIEPNGWSTKSDQGSQIDPDGHH